MKCPVDGCGANIIYVKLEGELITIVEELKGKPK